MTDSKDTTDPLDRLEAEEDAPSSGRATVPGDVPFVVRDVEDSDVPAMLTLYNDIIATTAAVWHDEQRTLEQYTAWLDERRHAHPVLVAEASGLVVGYATYGAFRPWAGYRYSVEHSVYVDAAERGRGVGTALLTSLVERARSNQMHAMIGGIDGENVASFRLHEKAGFTRVGNLPQVGHKFGRFLDLVFYQRLL
jgi:phosphinothricin acetyltransferase